MRALVRDRYGGIEQLRLADLPVPEPRGSEVLVAVAAVSLNLSDAEALHGRPAYARLDGLRRPRHWVLGSDIAGVIAAVGPESTRFTVGDAVFGDILARRGGLAEFAIAGEEELAPKPAALSFAEAACLPQAGAIAAQAVGRACPGDRMLLNGAGGGTGMLALQLARAAGIEVTGVDSAGKLDFMREVGASHVIDYRVADYTRTGPYDLVVDLVAHRSVFAYRRALAAGGRYLMVGGSARALLRLATVGPLLGALTGARLGVLLVRQGPTGFAPAVEACLRGDVTVRIDRTYPLAGAAEAVARLSAGRARGKLVIEIGER